VSSNPSTRITTINPLLQPAIECAARCAGQIFGRLVLAWLFRRLASGRSCATRRYQSQPSASKPQASVSEPSRHGRKVLEDFSKKHFAFCEDTVRRMQFSCSVSIFFLSKFRLALLFLTAKFAESYADRVGMNAPMFFSRCSHAILNQNWFMCSNRLPPKPRRSSFSWSSSPSSRGRYGRKGGCKCGGPELNRFFNTNSTQKNVLDVSTAAFKPKVADV